MTVKELVVVRVRVVLEREGRRGRRRRQEPGGGRDALNGRNRCLLLSGDGCQLQGLMVLVAVGLKGYQGQ